MKKLINLVLNSLMMISAISFSLTSGNRAVAQSTSFKDATIQETSSICQNVSVISNVTHTGNDSKTQRMGAYPAKMEVNAWDGSAPGLSWNDGTNSGCIALPDNSHDPDVALFESYNHHTDSDTVSWYAVVVYANLANDVICDLYYFYQGNFHRFSTSPFPYTLSSGGYTHTVNVDAIVLPGYPWSLFMVVWDDSSGDILGAGGHGFVDMEPDLCGNPTPNILVRGRNNIMPDVSLIERATSPASQVANAFYTYVDTSGSPDTLYVGECDFEDWPCGTTSAYNFPKYHQLVPPNSSSSSAEYFYPRIACPELQNDSDDEWTVAVELYDAGNKTDDIIGSTFIGDTWRNAPDHLGILYSNNIYTDGGTNTPSYGTIIHDYTYSIQFPVVAYDNAYGGIVIGWQSSFPWGGAEPFYPISCLTLDCDNSGGINSACANAYLIVPYNNSSGHTDQTALSISGRDFGGFVSSDEIHYTFYDGYAGDVLYKNVKYCDNGASSSLRMKLNQTEKEFNIFPNPFSTQLWISVPEANDDNIGLTIVDVTGNILLNVIGNETTLNKSLNTLADKLAQGIYLLQLIHGDSEIMNMKLVKI